MASAIIPANSTLNINATAHAAPFRFLFCSCASRKQLPPLSSSVAVAAAMTPRFGIGSGEGSILRPFATVPRVPLCPSGS